MTGRRRKILFARFADLRPRSSALRHAAASQTQTPGAKYSPSFRSPWLASKENSIEISLRIQNLSSKFNC